MQHMVLLSQFCLSDCPSVRRPSVRLVYCDKAKWWTSDILIPHEITLVFWHQHWLVGDAPILVKYSPKVTHPHSKHADSTVKNSEKKFNYDEYEVDHGLSNEV